MATLCNLCPNDCNVDREIKTGACRALATMKICRIACHHYEEPIISGIRGSGTVFFSGCSLDCEFCQNHLISKSYVGKEYTPNQLAMELKKLEYTGAHNINFVTPTHFSDKICEVLSIYRPNIPIVYNTSGYEKTEVIEKLNDFVDIYLVDMKYGDNETAKKFSKINNYCQYNFDAVKLMVDSKEIIIEDGLMKKGVIVRHLVLPDNLDNTKKVIETFAKNFKDKAIFSVMSQFVPCYKSTITRKLKPIEYKMVISALEKSGIEDCYIQELSSAETDYIPEFSLV